MWEDPTAAPHPVRCPWPLLRRAMGGASTQCEDFVPGGSAPSALRSGGLGHVSARRPSHDTRALSPYAWSCRSRWPLLAAPHTHAAGLPPSPVPPELSMHARLNARVRESSAMRAGPQSMGRSRCASRARIDGGMRRDQGKVRRLDQGSRADRGHSITRSSRQSEMMRVSWTGAEVKAREPTGVNPREGGHGQGH